jgi:hypothetical protein
MIQLRDIDLRYEIRVDINTGVVDLQRERVRVRRVYSAKIEGWMSNVMMAMYQGPSAQNSTTYTLSLFCATKQSAK